MVKRKKLFIAIAVILALFVPVSVFAAASDTPAAKTVRGFFGIDTTKLTDAQRADVKNYSQKMADLRKDFINKMVASGAMTREQGDAEIKRIDDALKASQENGTVFGMGKGMPGPGKGMFGDFGRQGAVKNPEGFDASKLTDKQKADLAASTQKMTDLQKELIDKMVADNLLTKQQGDNLKSKLDTMMNASQAKGFAPGLMKGGIGMFGFGFFGMNGIDTTKLTDQQKTDLTDYSKKMAGLEKELINKMIANGALTKEQGDAAIKRTEDMLNNQQQNGFQKGMGMMRKGRFNGRMGQNVPGNPGGSGSPVNPGTDGSSGVSASAL